MDFQGDWMVQYGTILQILSVKTDIIKKGVTFDPGKDIISNEFHVVKSIWHNRSRYVQTT